MDAHTLFVVWLIAGILLGLGHAASLWLTTRLRDLVWLPVTGLLRFVLLGGVLAGAVLSDGILPAAVGWALGFSTAAATLVVATVTPQRAR
ncbi:MAG: hypothetical protein RIC55_16035 [Pirellulaceae bacterium]